jgi:hypothetical protein
MEANVDREFWKDKLNKKEEEKVRNKGWGKGRINETDKESEIERNNHTNKQIWRQRGREKEK